MSTTQRFAGTIAVTGATGQLGSQTVEFLLKLAPEANLVALVRDPSKARSLPTQGVDAGPLRNATTSTVWANCLST